MTSYLEFKLFKHMHFCYLKYRILIQELRALTSQYIFSQKFYLKAPVNIIKFILHKMLLFLVKFKMFYIDRHLASPFVYKNYIFLNSPWISLIIKFSIMILQGKRLKNCKKFTILNFGEKLWNRFCKSNVKNAYVWKA